MVPSIHEYATQLVVANQNAKERSSPLRSTEKSVGDVKKEDLAERVRGIDQLRTAKVNGVNQLAESDVAKKFMAPGIRLTKEAGLEEIDMMNMNKKFKRNGSN